MRIVVAGREKIGNICPLVGSSPDERGRKTDKNCRNSCNRQGQLLQNRGNRAPLSLIRASCFEEFHNTIACDPEDGREDSGNDQWIYPETQADKKTKPGPAQQQLPKRGSSVPALRQA